MKKFVLGMAAAMFGIGAVSQSVAQVKSKSYARRSFRNYGIPPKVYGMYYVKRGTHKRTNV